LLEDEFNPNKQAAKPTKNAYGKKIKKMAAKEVEIPQAPSQSLKQPIEEPFVRARVR